MRSSPFSSGFSRLCALCLLTSCSGASGASSPVGGGGHSASGSSASASGASSGGDNDGGPICDDPCPAPSGSVDYECKSRFMYGVNYAWSHFAGDFGGISQWGQPGVAQSAAEHSTKLADMRAHGASVVRWWVFPDFRGDGIDFDASEAPTGLGGTAKADLQKALELADQADVYLMLCLFSFDAFRPSEDVAGVFTPGITPIVKDADKRKKLLENVVRPLSKAAEASPYKRRLIAWDVINEPEWAIAGASPYGDPDYDPIPELAAVSHQEMEAFLAETIKVLRSESGALVTVGAAAMKWSKAWSALDLDFYQFHLYDWINQYWPYTGSPADYGVDDKPVVMGEFPLGGLSAASYSKLVNSLYSNGYAGAMGWQYNEATSGQLADMKAFADANACPTRY